MKDRVALHIIQDAFAAGLLQEGGLITEGTAGSTGLCTYHFTPATPLSSASRECLAGQTLSHLQFTASLHTVGFPFVPPIMLLFACDVNLDMSHHWHKDKSEHHALVVQVLAWRCLHMRMAVVVILLCLMMLLRRKAAYLKL